METNDEWFLRVRQQRLFDLQWRWRGIEMMSEPILNAILDFLTRIDGRVDTSNDTHVMLLSQIRHGRSIQIPDECTIDEYEMVWEMEEVFDSMRILFTDLRALLTNANLYTPDGRASNWSIFSTPETVRLTIGARERYMRQMEIGQNRNRLGLANSRPSTRRNLIVRARLERHLTTLEERQAVQDAEDAEIEYDIRDRAFEVEWATSVRRRLHYENLRTLEESPAVQDAEDDEIEHDPRDRENSVRRRLHYENPDGAVVTSHTRLDSGFLALQDEEGDRRDPQVEE
jgi:hypothetical protein